jgi:hypothetical protein
MGRHGGHQPPPRQPQPQPQGQYASHAPSAPQQQYAPPGHYGPFPQGQYAPPRTAYQQAPYGQPLDGAAPQYQQAPGPRFPNAAPRGKSRHWVRNTLLVVGGLVVLIVVAAVVKTAVGASPVTVDGTVTPLSGASSASGSGFAARTYARCALASPKPGTQITITTVSGQVIGTGTLGEWAHSTVTVAGVSVYRCDMPFTIKNVPPEARYGFSLSGLPGTIWETSVSSPVNLRIPG